MGASGKSYRAIVESIDEGVVLLDRDARYLYVNPASERILGVKEADILSTPIWDTVAKTLSVALRAAYERVLGGEEVQVLRNYFARGHWYEVCGRPTEEGIVLLFRDVTERTQEALRLSEERLRLAADAGQIGMIDYCPMTGELIWDRRCRVLWGLGPDAPVTYDEWLERVHPDDRPRVDTAVARALQPECGGELNGEYRTLECNGGEHWIHVRGKVSFDGNGRPQHFFGTMRDVTEQHHLDQLRDRLSGIFAHDLRSPLSAIRMASTLLVGANRDELRVATDIIVRGADRMGRMIDQLMDFTRVRLGGGMPFQRERVDLTGLCRELVAEAELGHPGRRVRCNFRGDCVGLWDRSQLGRIVSNLLSNALSHGAPGCAVDVSVRGEMRSVVLTVHNAGEPIPSDLLPRIFDPFRRGEPRPGAARGAGLGLGLFISKALVAAHDGEIDVRSSAGEGTTFSVRLPRVRQPEARLSS
ncbi:MAG: Sensor protein [Myxococcaceae bacterium]|nr:Sensor protein [Myxococcaceae bacterium]